MGQYWPFSVNKTTTTTNMDFNMVVSYKTETSVSSFSNMD